MVEHKVRQLGDYRLIQLLGDSTTMEIYLSEHILLKTLSVLKVIRAPLLEQAIPACLREARSIASLTHPNIVRMLDFGEQDETFFLVMEYVPGDTLRQRYPPHSHLSPASLVSVMKPIADALQYAHDQNSIHGSVKPKNILLDADNEVLLSDFRISTLLQCTSSYQVSPDAYTAPEQFTDPPQPTSDQYALAVIAYELLHGELPSQDAIVTISGHMPDIDQVLHMALEKDPTRRFGSMRAFSRALEQACSSMPEQVISTESSSELTTIYQSPIALPSPLEQYIAYQSQDITPTEEYNISVNMQGIDAGTITTQDFVQPVADPFPSEQRTPDDESKNTNDTSRRIFLAGIGGSAIVIGGVVVLAASGKLTHLFTRASAKPSQVPGAGAKPAATAALTEIPTEVPPTPTPNLPIGTTLTTYTGQSSDVTGVCWSPTVSSRVVASCSQDGTASIWNTTTGQATRIFPQSVPRTTLAWSPNGQYLALVDGINIGVWDGAGVNLITTCTGHTKLVLGIAWSPDSQRLVSSSQDNTAIVWDAATGNQRITFKGHTQYVWVVAWAPDGNSIATGSWDNTVQIWNPDTAALLFRYTSTRPVRAVDWSPNSSFIASGGDDNSIHVWQAANGNVLTTYNQHSNHIEAVQWSPNGLSIASASKDATAQIWQASNANPIYTYTGHSNLIWSLTWSPDGQLIVSGSQDQTAKVWQAV